MKTSNLPDLDLARLAPLPRDRKRHELENMRAGRPPYSYRRFRQRILDILNITPGPLATLPRTPWRLIEADLRRPGGSPNEIEANIQVGKGLYEFASARELSGRHQEFFSLNIGISEKVVYWSPVILGIDGVPAVPFFDPRRSKKLTAIGRRFVFSVMHERIRVLEPDLADARLIIFQFENSDRGPRAPVMYSDDGIELFRFEELDAMVRETYEIWREVLEGREAGARSGGGRGGLL